MGNEFRHFGVCDASAAIAVGDEHFIVANDEDNIFHLYDGTKSEKFLESDSIFTKLGEIDIEGAAQIEDRIYWIASHSRNKDAEEQPSRHKFFATRVKAKGQTLSQIGNTYTDLLKHLSNKFPEIKQAAEQTIGPEEKGGLNIEGLAACSDNGLILGFRNPILEGKAFLVKLLNPSELIENTSAIPQFSYAIRLDLGGRGVRAIAYWATKNCYLIVGGSYNDDPIIEGEPNFVLYKWDGNESNNPEKVNVDLGTLSPEAIVIYKNGKVQLLSDDGGQEIDGKKCKKLAEKARTNNIECKKCYFRSSVVEFL